MSFVGKEKKNNMSQSRVIPQEKLQNDNQRKCQILVQ